MVYYCHIEKLKLVVDNHKNLKAIEGSDELSHKWADLFFDYSAYEEKLRYGEIFRSLPTIYTSNGMITVTELIPQNEM